MKLKLKNGMVVELKGDSANVQDQYDALRTVVADAEAMPSIKSDMDAMQKRVDQMMLDMAASNEKLDEYDARMDGLKKMFGEFMEEEGLVSDEDGAMKEELIEEMFKGDAAEAVKGRLTVLRKKAGTRRVAAIRERLQLEGHAKTLKVDSAETLEPLALRRAMLAKLTGEEYRADASEAEVKGALEMALKYQSRGANTSSNAASQTAAGITEGRSQIADAADQTVSAREKYIAAQAAASKRS